MFVVVFVLVCSANTTCAFCLDACLLFVSLLGLVSVLVLVVVVVVGAVGVVGVLLFVLALLVALCLCIFDIAVELLLFLVLALLMLRVLLLLCDSSVACICVSVFVCLLVSDCVGDGVRRLHSLCLFLSLTRYATVKPKGTQQQTPSNKQTQQQPQTAT